MGLLDKTEKINRKGKKDLDKRAAENPVENVGTNIDLIYYAVMEKKNLSLSKLASIFKVSLNKVEEWARVLDKQGLLELHYPVVGDPELRIKQVKKKEPSKGKENKSDKNKEKVSILSKIRSKWLKKT